MMQIRATLAVVIVLGIYVTGFAAADSASVVLTSHPEGAKIYVNGYYKGHSPTTVTVGSAATEAKSYACTLHCPASRNGRHP